MSIQRHSGLKFTLGTLLGMLVANLGVAVASGGFHFDMALYADAPCNSCNLSIPLGETRDMFIVADTDYPRGITGAELRVAGLPAGWTYVVIPNPASNVNIGNPMDATGGNIAFPTGTGAGPCILLYRVAITATTVASDVMLRIVARDPPINPAWACPLLVPHCDECFWKVCVNGRPLWINSGQDCVVGTTTATWSAIKSIYRD